MITYCIQIKYELGTVTVYRLKSYVVKYGEHCSKELRGKEAYKDWMLDVNEKGEALRFKIKFNPELTVKDLYTVAGINIDTGELL